MQSYANVATAEPAPQDDRTRDAWFGPSNPALGWVPAPRYLMRRERVLKHLKAGGAGTLVEIGSATGALLSELDELGFDCTGLESSSDARAVAQAWHAGRRISFMEAPEPEWQSRFDYVLTCEVLEHIEDDAAALTQWAGWLKPKGTLVLSVPAHPRLWNGRDVWAGHYRRYRKAGLESVFAKAGLEIETLECYGFPLANLLEVLAARRFRHLLKPDAATAGEDKETHTARSGIDRARDISMFNYYGRAPGAWIMRAMLAVQTLFLNTSFGNGYIVVARKPG